MEQYLNSDHLPLRDRVCPQPVALPASQPLVKDKNRKGKVGCPHLPLPVGLDDVLMVKDENRDGHMESPVSSQGRPIGQ